MEANEFVAMIETALARAQIEVAVGQAVARPDRYRVNQDNLRGAQLRIDEKHRAFIKRGKIWQCEHNPINQTRGIFWAVFLPGYCCVNCYKMFCDALSGTPEDYRCDLCGTIVDVDDFRNGVWTIPAIPQPGGGLLPPLTISFGVCMTCVKKEQHG